ncbi:MAG: hypothetical protein ACFFAU_16120 [Candidatus Hodarchaeota archaeon]
MSESVNSVSDYSKSSRFDVIKVRILAFGLIIIGIAFLLFQFFIQLRYPPELKFPDEIKPAWTQDQNLVDTMAFVGDFGIIFSWFVLLIGLCLALYGLINRILDKRIPRKRFKETLIESFFITLGKDKNFALVTICTIIFALMWLFNILTYPPSGPLYFLRKPFLQIYFPEIQADVLPSLSTYGAFAVIQDTVILIIFLYIIYVRLRPGKQLGEDFVNFALDRTLFLIVLMVTSLYHAIGHLPFELYGRGQWGSGFNTIEAWIAFDKIAHCFTSMAITMLFVAIVTNQFSKYGAETTASTLFALIVAISFMISLGLAWEIYEWITNWVLNLGHFEDEILDAPKDLVWDAIGATAGAILAFVDKRRSEIDVKNAKTI